MKGFVRLFKHILCMPIILLVILLAGIFLLFYIPIDLLKYLHSPYYQTTKEKYTFLCDLSPYFKLYNVIAENSLPVDFYRNKNVKINAFGYFVFKDTLILNDHIPHFDKSEQDWFVSQSENDGSDILVKLHFVIQNEMDEANRTIGQPVCEKAVLLVEKDALDKDDLKEADSVPYLLLYEKRGLFRELSRWFCKNNAALPETSAE